MLRYHQIEVTLKPSDLKPHPFIGSTLRGVFGMALKKVVCINPSFNCEGCFAQQNCLFYDFYEERNRAHQYRFDFHLNPKNYDFTLYLFEEATEKLPYVLSALHKMLTEEGLGKDRVKCAIDTIKVNGQKVYDGTHFDLKGIEAKRFTPQKDTQSVSVAFVTPLRMKHKGKLLTQKPPLETLLYSIANRLNEIKRAPRTKLPFTPRYKEKRASVRFVDQTRRSNRQKTKLQIGGIKGTIEYDDIDENSLIFLELGEILGVGKQTVFGMGKIALKSL